MEVRLWEFGDFSVVRGGKGGGENLSSRDVRWMRDVGEVGKWLFFVVGQGLFSDVCEDA